MRILVVEDDPDIAQITSIALRAQTYAVDVAPDGETGSELAFVNTYDLIILDVMLPGKDGVELCRELRERGDGTPVLMVTSRSKIEQRVSGLDAGADDYLVKPFAIDELLARVRALLRRSRDVRPQVLRVADLELDTLTHSAERAGRRIVLTGKEYALLEFLMCNVGRVLSRAEIGEHVWDDSYDPFTNLIEVYMLRLRKKIDLPDLERLIHTRRGEGYIFAAGADAAESVESS